MKISLEWLTEYLPGSVEASVAAEALTNGGLPVEVIEQKGDDTVIDVEVTSNRGDCLSHIGVARELAALLDRPFLIPEPMLVEVGAPAGSVTSVTIEATQLCPHYVARVLRGVKIGPSPQWMQRRLEAVGLRPINNVVDVTNYVMFEMGQPLHAFDFETLGGKKIVVRNSRLGESLTSIDGHDRRLTADMLVIADAAKPVALAGVMGGRDSEVSDSTVNVLLESARFDPLSIRTTARKLAMGSDSSYRFERGIDPTLPRRASARAAQLILETAGGELLRGTTEAGSDAAPVKNISLRLDRLTKLLGIELPHATVIDALTRLQLNPTTADQRIDVVAPSWRGDLNIEADIIEEVARVAGYDKIPISEAISIRVTPPDPRQRTIAAIRSTLVGCGFFEAVTVTFISDLLADEFTPPGAKLPRADAMVRKADGRLRPSMLPGLLEAIARNESAGTPDPRLFEIGSTFSVPAQSSAIDERRQLGIAGGQELREIRGAVELLLNRLDSSSSRRIEIVPASQVGFAPDACGRIEFGGKALGFLGKISSAVCQKLDLRSHPVGAELNLETLLSCAVAVPQSRPLPRFPAIRRDLSLIVSEATRFDALQKLIDQANLPDLEDVEYVGSYRGKPLVKGQKSITISLVFRSANQTLTSQAVDTAVKRVVSDAGARIGATLRA